MPDKEALTWMTHIREFVFGMQDGVISTVGFLSGLQIAMENKKVLMVAGLAQVLTGGFSMAIGAYLSTKAEREVFEGVRKEEDSKRREEPYVAQEELLQAFQEDGLSREDGYRIVSILSRNRSAFRKTFYEKVLGISSAEYSQPLHAALVMFAAFMIGGFFPLSPYFFLQGKHALVASVIFSCVALFGTGYFKGVVVKKSPMRSGFEFFLIALFSAFFGYLVGFLLGIPI
jgi:vacuolar iron transporter family protein